MIIINMNEYLLISIVNTKLRDYYKNLDYLCEDLNLDKNELCNKLEKINYIYNEEYNTFIIKK